MSSTPGIVMRVCSRKRSIGGASTSKRIVGGSPRRPQAMTCAAGGAAASCSASCVASSGAIGVMPWRRSMSIVPRRSPMPMPDQTLYSMQMAWQLGCASPNSSVRRASHSFANA